MRATFLYHQMHAILMIIAALLLIHQYYNGSVSGYQSNVLLLLLSITVGIHTIIHFYEEIYFDFNPLAGKTTVYDLPYYDKNHGLSKLFKKN